MKIMLIDGNSILNRAFYGVRLLTNREGQYTNAVYGFLGTYFKVVDEEKPDGVCVLFDVPAKTFRHEKYEAYKAGRREMPGELASQIPILKDVLDLMGVSRLELAGFEADDLIGTLCRLNAQSGHRSVVLTGDKDSLQLVSAACSVRLVTTKNGQTASVLFDEETFKERYGGLCPKNIIDLKALSGDKSDNIPGVDGIGDKTAMELLLNFASVDGVYEHIHSDKIRDPVRKRLQAGEDSAHLSRILATIDEHAPVSYLPENTVVKGRGGDALYELFMRLGFKSFISRLSLSPAAPSAAAPRPRQSAAITDEAALMAFCEKLRATPYISLCMPKTLLACAVCFDDACYTVSSDDFSQKTWRAFTDLLFSGDLKLVIHDARELFVALMDQGFSYSGLFFDTAVGAYLLNPSESGYSLAKCALSYLRAELPPESAFSGDDSFSPLGRRDDALSALSAHSAATDSLYRAISPELSKNKMESLLDDIELPLVEVLASMQHLGFLVARGALERFGESIRIEISGLSERIFGLAGGPFNINSTRMLGEVLFERLSLPAVKKNKTGYSTDIEVLSKLKGKHEIVDLLIRYRELTKLLSTYVDGLIRVIHPVTGRIHSSFNQTSTSTGRLSSTDPNLQNIPVRREQGSEIRHMFIAGEGRTLIDADYSQIELRILAHISGDDAMKKAFLSGRDIHTSTAAEVFGVSPGDVTSEMRRAAKAVNFGIVYGISEFSLSQDIGTTRAEAALYIKNYFETYPGVAAYMTRIKKEARERGFVSTLYGRRRYLPELASSNFNIRSFGERLALNTPIQGTAADIIKIAMVAIYRRLSREKLRSRLILQVHDELIVEAADCELSYVEKLVRDEMERAADLSVPLVVDASFGKTWYDAKK